MSPIWRNYKMELLTNIRNYWNHPTSENTQLVVEEPFLKVESSWRSLERANSPLFIQRNLGFRLCWNNYVLCWFNKIILSFSFHYQLSPLHFHHINTTLLKNFFSYIFRVFDFFSFVLYRILYFMSLNSTLFRVNILWIFKLFLF